MLWNARVHCRVNKGLIPIPILSQMHPVLITPSHLSRIRLNAVTYMGKALRIIVDPRFDDWNYWTLLLQLELIIRAHTLNSFLTISGDESL
jgi:hypothetical protein